MQGLLYGTGVSRCEYHKQPPIHTHEPKFIAIYPSPKTIVLLSVEFLLTASWIPLNVIGEFIIQIDNMKIMHLKFWSRVEMHLMSSKHSFGQYLQLSFGKKCRVHERTQIWELNKSGFGLRLPHYPEFYIPQL